MAYVAQGAFVALNGIDLSGVLKSVKISSTADVLDRTALQDSAARKFQKGLVTREVTGEGFFKASATTAEDANGLFQTALTNTTGDYLLMECPEGTAEANPCRMINMKESRYEIDEVVGELIMATFSGNVTKTATAEHFQNGVVLFSDTATGATNGTSYDAGGATTGWFVQLQMLDGDGNANVKIQHSTNNSVWADLYSIGSVAVNTAYQYSDTDDAVNRYIRFVVNSVAGTTNTIVAGLRLEYVG